MTPNFIPGIELSRRFYFEVVRPLLDQHFPALAHAAAHIGSGSDVLSFDTEMSRDHDWGPTVTLLLKEDDAPLIDNIREVMDTQLSTLFYDYPVIIPTHIEGAFANRITVATLWDYVWQQWRYDLNTPFEKTDWLMISSQKFREMTGGAVHFDNIGDLTALRQKWAWYPRDVWLYLMACGWQRIGQEEHLMPRAGYVGEEIGSSLIGSRLVRDIMNLCFLMERQYAPYPKWFGTAFKQLDCAAGFVPILERVQLAQTWQDREKALCKAYEMLACQFNTLGITTPLPTTTSRFHDRPFYIIHGERFAEALIAQITEPDMKHIAARRLIGNIDQFSDNTDMLSDAAWRLILRKLYVEDLD
jgi:hypothetical protein